MRRDLLRALGPGVLFAGAAVGVSHLVQSTRAGAVYGLGLVGLVVVANVVKYPAFRFGPMFAAATGTSMLEGYRRQGRWALVLYGLLTFGTMFTVQAAVTMVTAGLATALLGFESSTVLTSALILVLCAGLIATGGYRALDKVSKVLVSFLALSTLVATVLIVPRIDWGAAQWLPTRFEPVDLAFMAALVGWMPSAIDVSVWQSLWTLARTEETGRPSSVQDASAQDATVRASSFDFHLGYIGTSVLAICFVLLGTAVLHRQGTEVAAGAGAFAAQLISLYVEALGEWSRPLIGGAALGAMFSTTLTVVDGFPRALSVLVDRLKTPEESGSEGRSDRTVAYWVAVAVLFVGSMLIVAFFRSSMRGLIDLATTLSFFSAPLLSWLNHRAVTSEAMPADARPARWLVVSSWAAIVVQAAFAIGFALLIR